MRSYRYSRWDGTQEVDPFTASDLMEHLSDRVLNERDLATALRELMQRGGQLPSGRQMPGLRDLLERLRERRDQQLQRFNLGSIMDDIKQRLDQIVETERSAIERRLADQQNADADQGLRDMFQNL